MTCSQVARLRTLTIRLNANRIRRTPCCIAYCIANSVFNVILGTLTNQASKRTLRVTRCSVDQYTIHSILITCFFTVNSLTNGGTAISTFKTELINNQMCKCVNQDKFRTKFADGTCTEFGTSIRILKISESGKNSWPLRPFFHSLFLELKEDTFAMDLYCGQPVFASESEHFLSFRDGHFGWFCTGESNKGSCFTKLVYK